MHEQTIDFWFSIGSTYTYLSANRLAEVSQRTGIEFRWRPFDVRAIMLEMDNLPFAKKPVKASYMWRDLERRAVKYGIPWAGIPPYPLKDLPFATRIALVGSQEGWCANYVTTTYHRWFVQGEEAGQEPNVSNSLREIGQEPERVLALASSDDMNSALQAETSSARELGIFGAPTFVVGTEVFWGDDRLEDAINWHRHGSLGAAAVG